MSNLLPTGFPLFGSPVSASFDSADIDSGNRYVQYRLFTSSLSGATTYNLGTTDVYSYDISKTGTGGQPNAELNFDSAIFNLPRTANGTAYFSAGFADTTAGTGNVQVILYKVDTAGTETALSAQLSGANIGGSGTTLGMWLIPIPLTQTLIKSGEFLRLGVTIWENGNPWEFGHDPQGRPGVWLSGASVTTKSNIYVPFKVDVGQ